MVKNTLISTPLVVLPGLFIFWGIRRFFADPAIHAAYFFAGPSNCMSDSQLAINCGQMRTSFRLER